MVFDKVILNESEQEFVLWRHLKTIQYHILLGGMGVSLILMSFHENKPLVHCSW